MGAVEPAEQINQRRHETRPAGLVTRSQTRAVVAVEILVEQHVVFPVGIGLELFRAAVYRALPRVIAEKDSG